MPVIETPPNNKLAQETAENIKLAITGIAAEIGRRVAEAHAGPDQERIRGLVIAHAGEVLCDWLLGDFTPVPVVHILQYGLPLCRFTPELPEGWPQGHRWVGLDERNLATCPTCILQAKLYEKLPKVRP